MSSNAKSPSDRLPNVQLDRTLVNRLETLASSVLRRSPEIGERLIDEIARADLVAPDDLGDDVVTLGSEVTYRDLHTGKAQTVTLVYPEEADIGRNRISVLTPIGVALLGLREGAMISWTMRTAETRQLEVASVSPPASE